MIQIDETESAFQARVTKLAEELGWEWLHLGHGIGYGSRGRQGVKGTLAKGWPDLTLLRGNRLLFLELKAQKAPPPTVTQQLVLGLLASTGAETLIARPSDWALLCDVLASVERPREWSDD